MDRAGRCIDGVAVNIIGTVFVLMAMVGMICTISFIIAALVEVFGPASRRRRRIERVRRKWA